MPRNFKNLQHTFWGLFLTVSEQNYCHNGLSFEGKKYSKGLMRANFVWLEQVSSWRPHEYAWSWVPISLLGGRVPVWNHVYFLNRSINYYGPCPNFTDITQEVTWEGISREIRYFILVFSLFSWSILSPISHSQFILLHIYTGLAN